MSHCSRLCCSSASGTAFKLTGGSYRSGYSGPASLIARLLGDVVSKPLASVLNIECSVGHYNTCWCLERNFSRLSSFDAHLYSSWCLDSFLSCFGSCNLKIGYWPDLSEHLNQLFGTMCYRCMKLARWQGWKTDTSGTICSRTGSSWQYHEPLSASVVSLTILIAWYSYSCFTEFSIRQNAVSDISNR